MIVHGYLSVKLGAVWLVVEQDLPVLAEVVDRMATYLAPSRSSRDELMFSND